MTEISVILPVYNAASFVGEAIKSLLNQTFTDFEILALNDGSTDQSEQVILGFKDDRIRYIVSEENKGLIHQLNLGIKEAQGKYIARLDADDIAFPERLSIQYRFMQENPTVVLCGSYASVMGDETRILSHAKEDADIRIELLQHNAFIHSTVMYRKDIIEKHNLVFDEHYKHAEDYHMWVLLSSFGKLANIPQSLIQYRMHEHQVSRQFEQMLNKHADKIRRLQIAKLKGRSLTAAEDQLHFALFYPALFMQSIGDVYKWTRGLKYDNNKKGLYAQAKFNTWLEQKYVYLLKDRFLWSKSKISIRDFLGSRVLLNSGLSFKEKISLIKNNIVS